MEALFVLAGLALLLGCVMGWVAFFMVNAANTRINELERRITSLRDAGRVGAMPGAQTFADADASAPKPPAPRRPTVETASVPGPAPAPVARAAASVPVSQPARTKASASTTASSEATPPRATRPNSTRPKATPSKSTLPKVDLETLLGARGSVIIGGIALLIGAVFLLRYTIEAGLLTPAMRIGLAVVMGVIALAASEVLARREPKSRIARELSGRIAGFADIPAVLAAVGLFSLFGALYAAHALYGMLSATPAFLGLGVVALGGLGLSLRRGQTPGAHVLAGIGLVGALVVPFLVASTTPSFLGVLVYAALITAAALGVARIRAWPWLAVAAATGGAFWLAMLVGKAVDVVQFGAWTLGLAALLTLCLVALWRFGAGLPSTRDKDHWSVAAGWIGAAVLSALAMSAGDDLVPFSAVLPLVVLAVLIALSVLENGAGESRRLPFWPALFIALGLAFHPVPLDPLPEGWPTPARLALIWVLALAGLLASVRIGARLSRAGPDARPHGGLAMVTLTGGMLAVAFAWWSLGTAPPRGLGQGLGIETSWADLAVLSSLSVVAAVAAWRSGSAPISVSVSASALIVAAFGTLASAAQFDDAWQVSLALSLGLAVTTGIALRRDSTAARLAPLGLAGLCGLVAWAVIQADPDLIGPRPMLNELWLFLGLPGGLAALGGWAFSRRRDDIPAQLLVGGSVAATLLLVVLLIHHAMNGGDLSADVGFESLAVQLLVAFAAMLGASWARGKLTTWPGTRAPVSEQLVPGLLIGASLLSLVVFAIGQLLAFNPLFNGATRIDGHVVFNSLLLGFALPSVLLGVGALRYAGRRPVWFVRALGILSGLAWLAFVTAQIRRTAHGPRIDLAGVSWQSAELYAVSAAWLLSAIALLLAGLKSRRRDLRLASAVLMVITIFKVFFVDMAQLEGALRAGSFIGLGVVLLGIGQLYQRLLLSPKSEEKTGVEA